VVLWQELIVSGNTDWFNVDALVYRIRIKCRCSDKVTNGESRPIGYFWYILKMAYMQNRLTNSQRYLVVGLVGLVRLV